MGGFRGVCTNQSQAGQRNHLLPNSKVVTCDLSYRQGRNRKNPTSKGYGISISHVPMSISERTSVHYHFCILINHSTSFIQVRSITATDYCSSEVRPMFRLLTAVNQFKPTFLCKRGRIFSQVRATKDATYRTSSSPIITVGGKEAKQTSNYASYHPANCLPI